MTTQAAVADGQIVTIHYTLKNDAGETLDSSSGGEPLSYLHGADNIVPGLERELTGRQTGDKLTVVVQPEDGYGTREGPEPQPVPRSAFPDDAELRAGMQILAQGPSGDPFPLWLVSVSEDHVLVDQNHPLAGVTLHFEVEITGIRAATDEEKSHGHPHGPGGHHH